MAKIRIALMQLLPGKSQQENLRKGLAACRAARKAGADIALFPEMWSCGYEIPQEEEALKALAIGEDDPFLMEFAALAKETEMAICVGFLQQWEPLPRNAAVLFDRHGERKLLYAKVHTCDFGDEARLTRGEGFYTAELDTAAGSVPVGIMICYDREFPESARLLMLQGAEIILTPNACPMEINRLSQLRGRAYENMLCIATCSYPAGKPDCNGHSTVFDGVAYLPELPGSRDTCLLEAGEEEGIYYADLDLSMLRSYRSEEVHGNAYRRPELYGALTEEKIRPPFVRSDRKP